MNLTTNQCGSQIMFIPQGVLIKHTTLMMKMYNTFYNIHNQKHINTKN